MALDLARIRAVLFDIDGTLSDTDDQWVERMDRILRPLSFAFPLRSTRDFSRRLLMSWETPGNRLYTQLDRLDLDTALFGALKRFSRARLPKGRQSFLLVPGVAQMIAALYPRFALGVVSARDEDSSLAFLDQFHLRGYFGAIASAQTCRYTKPLPDPLLWAAEQLRVPPQDCLMVGDTTVDILAGRAAGTQTLGVLCGFGDETELRQAGADDILPSTADLARMLIA